MNMNSAEKMHWIKRPDEQRLKGLVEAHGKYRVHLRDADGELRRRCNESAKAKYGNHLPDMVQNRLNLELEAIGRNNYSSEYLIGAMLAEKSLTDGYMISSRGLIGSSFVAYLCGVSNVNPLPAHYYCSECHHFESTDAEYNVMGYDLPDKTCPVCGRALHIEGANIAPEILMGINLDHEPDIVLNVASEEQEALVDYIKNTFGKDNVVRAGVKVILEKGNVRRNIHPGGFFIVPDGVNLADITDLRDDISDDHFKMRVTERDYREINGILKKYDVLRSPETDLLNRLQKITGVKGDSIKTNDSDILKLFIDEGFSFLPNHRGNIEGIETSGLSNTGISCFSDLVAISAMLHGSCIWENNIKLIRKDGIRIKDLISSRDDVMQALISKGMQREQSYMIMNRVRKGKGLTAEMENAMRSAGVPAWFVDTCKKVRYLFPKAHAVEYTLLYWKLAYYKLNFPDIYQTMIDDYQNYFC